MSQAAAAVTGGRVFPFTVSVGGSPVTLRMMGASDREAVQNFVKQLSERDLFFLLVDIRKPHGLDQWFESVESGRTLTILAERDGNVIGYSSLHRSDLHWTRHVGEIRLQVAPNQSGRGIGSLLVNEIFLLASTLGLHKIISRMPASQERARRLFEHLGFTAEAMFADGVMDEDGRTLDLIVMSFDVTGLTS